MSVVLHLLNNPYRKGVCSQNLTCIAVLPDVNLRFYAIYDVYISRTLLTVYGILSSKHPEVT